MVSTNREQAFEGADQVTMIDEEVLQGEAYHDHVQAIKEGKVSGRDDQVTQSTTSVGTNGNPVLFEQFDFSVITPSGATLPVLTHQEVEYYESRAERYMTDHKFTSVTDLQDLDRVLSSELTLYRFDIWLALAKDYFGNSVSEDQLLRRIKDMSKTLMDLKKSMGLDKSTRDKDQGADFVSWLEDTRRRAKAFMIMRNEQFFMAITLFHELMGKVQTMRNADEIEREELGLHPEQILDWMWDDLFPRFNEVDRKFREDGTEVDGVPAQRYWVEGAEG